MGRRKFTSMTFGELDPTPVEHRIPGLLTMNGNVLVSAYRKSGKTTLILHLVAALTSKSMPFLGRPCTPLDGRLVYVNFEMEQNTLRDYADSQGIDLDSDRARVMDMRGWASKFNVSDEGWCEDFASWLRDDQEAAALIIDPIHVLSVTAGADSNSNDDARGLMERLGEIAAMAELTHLFIVDHTGHGDKTRARGASGKEDWADVLWNIRRDEDKEEALLSVTGRGVSGAASFARDSNGVLHAAEAQGGDNASNRVKIAVNNADEPLTVKDLMARTDLSQSRISESLTQLLSQGNIRKLTRKATNGAELWASGSGGV